MNELHIAFIQRRQQTPQQDRRYRVLVDFKRSDRPRFWNFLCHNCGKKVTELQNMEVISMTDFYDPQNVANVGISINCKGIEPGSRGLACPYTYFFNLH